MSFVLAELSKNAPLQTDLMWNEIADTSIRGFKIYQSDQPAGTYSALGGEVPNIPGANHDPGPMYHGAALYGKRPQKVYTKITKSVNDTLAALGNGLTGDLTFYYKIQRILKSGAPHADDAVVANIPFKQIQSYEETQTHNLLYGYKYNKQRFRETIAIPNARLFATPNPVIFDIRQRHGRRAMDLRVRPAAVGLNIRLNNLNNPSITPDVPTAPDWDDFNDDEGNVPIHRLLIENTTGAPINITIDYNVEIN